MADVYLEDKIKWKNMFVAIKDLDGANTGFLTLNEFGDCFSASFKE